MCFGQNARSTTVKDAAVMLPADATIARTATLAKYISAEKVQHFYSFTVTFYSRLILIYLLQPHKDFMRLLLFLFLPYRLMGNLFFYF